MKDTESKSFETVELFTPVDMIPISGIGGIESAGPDSDPKKKTVSMTPDTVKHEKVEHIESLPETFKPQGEDNTVNGQSMNGNFVDFHNIFQDNYNYTSKPKQPGKRIRIVFIVSLAVFIIAAALMKNFVNGYNKRLQRENKTEYNTDIKNSSDLPVNNLVMQDETYGIIDFNSNGEVDTDLVSVNHEIIEYTGLYERCLYFRVTPKDDNVSIRINVEMLDKNGEPLGKVSGTSLGIPKGKEGVIPVSMDISPFMDFSGITYNISVDTRKSSGKVIKREISDMNVQDGVIYVSISGEKYVDKYAYMIFYKNNNIVSVQWKQGLPEVDTAVIEFDTKDIKFDTCQIYYRKNKNYLEEITDMRLSENTTIGELLDEAPEMKEILADIGMHCSSCPSARRETLKQAAEVHDMDIEDLLEDIKGFLEG